MEPLNDRQLEHLLDLWKGPLAPADLEEKIMADRSPWWRKVLRGILRRQPFKGRWRRHRTRNIGKV
jgi:hypothetical protein